MDIEELRAKAMASMPNKKKKRKPQALLHPLSSGKFRSTNNLLDTNVTQLQVSSALSVPLCGRKEKDVFLSSLQDIHPAARSPAAEEKDDNLVIRFSDGDTDSEGEEQIRKVDQREKDGSSRENTSGNSASQSLAASSQMATTTSQQTSGMRNQMAMMQKQLTAIRTTMSSAVQVRGVTGEGPPRQSSCNEKPLVGHIGLIGQKHAFKPGSSVTKLSGSDLDNLRKQIATKENELKLQRHIRSGKGQDTRSVPSGALHTAGIAESTTMSGGEKISVNPTFSMLTEGASVVQINEEKQKVPKVRLQELPDPSVKVSKSSLQQQKRQLSNVDIDLSCMKDGSSNGVPTKDSHAACSKRSVADSNLLVQKHLKSAAGINEKHIRATDPLHDLIQEHCTKVENNRCPAEFSMSVPAEVLIPYTPSKHVISEDFHLTNNHSLKGEGSKKRKLEDVSPAEGQSLFGDASLVHQKHTPDEGSEKKADIKNLRAMPGFPVQESEEFCLAKAHMEFQEIGGQPLNKRVKVTHIEDCHQNSKSDVEQSLVNYSKDAKEGIDRTGGYPLTQEVSFNIAHSMQLSPAGLETFVDDPCKEPEQAVKSRTYSIVPSKDVVESQDRIGPLSNNNTELMDSHIQDGLLQVASISVQDLMKQEEIIDKDLEEARMHRNNCEIEEQMAWKDYRKAWGAVQAANQRCIYLHQKRERLSAQIRALGMRDYSLEGSPKRIHQSKEGLSSPRRFTGHKDLSNFTSGTHCSEDHFEYLKQKCTKLNDHGLGVDYTVTSSSNDSFLSIERNSNGTFSIADMVPNTTRELCIVGKKVDEIKIDASKCQPVAEQDQVIVSCEPEVFQMRKGQQKQMEAEQAVSRELKLEMIEAFPKTQSCSTSLQSPPGHETSLRPEKWNHCSKKVNHLLDSVKGTSVENDGNCGLLQTLTVSSGVLSDNKRSALVQCSNLDNMNISLPKQLPQRRDLVNQFPYSELGADGALASKEHLVSDSLSPTEKPKGEDTASPGAATNAESFHSQNDNHEEYGVHLTGNDQLFDCHPSQSLERLCEMHGEVLETTNVRYLGNTTGNEMQEDSAGTCHSDNSLTSSIECQKVNDRRFATTLSSMMYNEDKVEEMNEEKSHSGSSVDEGCAVEKENTLVWTNSDEEHATSGNFDGNTKCEQLELSDLAVIADLTVPGGGVSSCIANMEDQDYIQQCAHTFTSRQGVVQKTLKENSPETMIKSVNKNCCEDASSQLPKGDFWMPSPELKVVSHYPKELLPTAHGMVINASGKKAQRILHISPEHVPRFILYESPLDMFKSHRIYSDLITANGVPDKLITCSHVINPFWPLCNFEHRGKCNNEDCPWQHAKDYNLTPSQVLEQLNKYSNNDMDGSFGHQELRSFGNKDLQIYSEAATKEAIRSSKFLCKVTLEQSAMSRSLLHHNTGNYGLKVPVYRIGPHLLKADGPMVGTLIACSTWRFWKLGFCQSFSIPFAVQRLLPSDMPCLHSAAVREWMLGNNSRLPTCLYTSSVIGKPDDTQKHLFRGLGDIECWLELAIDSMNIDSNIDKSDGRKKALYVLSRAIEINPNSVAVWMAYLHIFYRKEKVIGTDDMFHHAVQHNKGSYELWLLFINSRLQMDQRLEAYNSAITALCQNVGGDENHVKSSSPFVLDIVLQMLNYLSMSGNTHKAMTWIDELLYCSSENYGKGQSDFISISTVLPYLRKKDVCVLMVCCTYFRVYGKLPKAILGRLEFEQELPFDVDWQNCQLSEASRDSSMKLMDFAVSSLSECCFHDSLELWKNDKDALLAVYALVVNHIKFVSAFEGLTSARDLCCHYRKLYPTCVELVPVYSCIESHCGGDTAGISVFQESLFNWPDNKPGIQRLWNLFVHYALDSKGVDFAKDLSNQWFCYMDQKKMLDSIISLKGAGYHMFYASENAEDKQGVDESKDRRKGAHHFLARTDMDQKCWSKELMFGLLNLARHRLLNNDAKEAQTFADQALKVASDDRDVKHCIREYAALAVLGSPEGLETIKNGFDTRMLQVLDKCFQESQLFPVAKPLSRAFSEKIKKPKIRLFIDNLLGPIPLDSSLLNSVIETWYGPSLLPRNFGALKDLVDFVEGLLELAPANLNLVLSISRLIGQRYNSQSMSSMAAVLWASSLLINSIFQSFPIAPEDTWIEVGNFLELLDIDIILEEFYQKALSVHPFSVTLWHSFFNFRQHTDNLGGVVEAAKQRGIVLD